MSLRLEPPERVDQAALLDTVAELSSDDLTNWKLYRERGETRVWSSLQTGISPVRYYRTQTVHPVASDVISRFFFDDCPKSLSRYTNTGSYQLLANEVVVDRVDGSADAKVVYIAYGMPWPLRDRDFLYLLAQRRADDSTLIGTLSVAMDTPAANPATIRGLVYPTGYRLTPLPDGRTRLDYVVSNAMGGTLSPWVMNHLAIRSWMEAGWHEAERFLTLFGARAR